MSRRHESKYRIDRRVGENIWGRAKSPVNRRPYKPGQHGQGRRTKESDYALQLKAKQKLKFHYGDITEKQFRRTYDEASRQKGNTAENLIGLLESRLEAFVYRCKFVPTIFAARQLVNHGHVRVNGQKVNIGSYRLQPGDTVALRDKAKAMALVLEALGSGERDVPDYIDVDPKAMSATFVRVPELVDVPYAVQMEPAQVVEFYSS